MIFGIVKKVMTVLTLAVIFNTTNFGTVMTAVQLVVLALVSMLYILCYPPFSRLRQNSAGRKQLL